MSSKPAVIGGKLKLKGSGGAKKPKTKSKSKPSEPKSEGEEQDVAKTSTTTTTTKSMSSEDDHLTPAQRRHKKRKIEAELRDIKQATNVSFRERVEQFNNKLARMTEHNDIPRVSAAGNG